MNQQLYAEALSRLITKRLGYAAAAQRDLDLMLQVPKDTLGRVISDPSNFKNKHEHEAAIEAWRLINAE